MNTVDPLPAGVLILLLTILLALSAFFSASEVACMAASKLHIKYLREKKHRSASRVAFMLRDRNRFLNTILVGNNIVNISLSALITTLSIGAFGEGGVAIATISATIVILIFGEILPKSIALTWPEPLALALSLPLRFFFFVSAPLVAVFSLITRGITFVAGVRRNEALGQVTTADLKSMIEIGEEEGVLESSERDMLHKIIDYTGLTARDVMVPRTSITAVPLDISRSELLSVARDSRYSRFPVYGDSIDDIKGIVFIKDFLFSASGETFRVADIIRPALFVFESRRMAELQSHLRSANQNMAVVVDEYGGTAGIVTIEDLVEEIFGGIRDEFDREESPRAGTAGDLVIVPGTERLTALGEKLGISLSSEHFDTIAGFIMERLGDIPARESVVMEQGYAFVVTETEGNRVKTVTIDREGAKR